MKNNWQTKKLGEIANIYGGGTPPTNVAHYFQGNINWFTPTELPREDITILNESQRKISEDAQKFTRMSEPGTVLLSSRATIGNVAILSNVSGYNQGIKGIEPRKGEMENLYLAYWLKSKKEDLIAKSSGTTFKEISTNRIRALEISYPSLPEQKRIVTLLDKIFEKIERAKKNNEKNLQNSREIFDSYIRNILSNDNEKWEQKRLCDVCEKITDGTHQTPTYYNNGILFLSSRNVTSGKIDWEKIKYIDTKQHMEMHKRVAPKLNDILLAKNGTTGVAALVDRDITFDIYVSLALLRAREMILPSFLLYFINSPVAKKQFNKRLKGAGVPNLHLEEIREVSISFPKSISDQKAIVKKLDELSMQTKKMEEIYKKKLVHLEELKKSVLQRAFNGDL